MEEAWVKRVKHVGNGEEASVGASNDAVVASLGRTVGGHARVGAGESEDGSDSESSKWSTSGKDENTTEDANDGRSADTPACVREKAGMAAAAAVSESTSEVRDTKRLVSHGCSRRRLLTAKPLGQK